MKRIDLSGKRFGRWTVQGDYIEYSRSRIMWRCICDCGEQRHVHSNSLRIGDSKSCGCYRDDFISKKFRTHGHTQYKCGRAETFPEYNTWASMKQRCYYLKCSSYPRYGGRGITVCDRWKNSFENFLEDMGKRPNKKMTLDRIDVNGNYEPSNCKWSSRLEQSRNRSHVLDRLKLKAATCGVDYECLKKNYVVYGMNLTQAIEFSDKI